MWVRDVAGQEWCRQVLYLLSQTVHGARAGQGGNAVRDLPHMGAHTRSTTRGTCSHPGILRPCTPWESICEWF